MIFDNDNLSPEFGESLWLMYQVSGVNWLFHARQNYNNVKP